MWHWSWTGQVGFVLKLQLETEQQQNITAKVFFRYQFFRLHEKRRAERITSNNWPKEKMWFGNDWGMSLSNLRGPLYSCVCVLVRTRPLVSLHRQIFIYICVSVSVSVSLCERAERTVFELRVNYRTNWSTAQFVFVYCFNWLIHFSLRFCMHNIWQRNDFQCVLVWVLCFHFVKQ